MLSNEPSVTDYDAYSPMNQSDQVTTGDRDSLTLNLGIEDTYLAVGSSGHG